MVVVSVHVVVKEVIPSVAPDALQAAVCDEQLEGFGGEIALSENKKRKGTTTPKNNKNKIKMEKKSNNEK